MGRKLTGETGSLLCTVLWIIHDLINPVLKSLRIPLNKTTQNLIVLTIHKEFDVMRRAETLSGLVECVPGFRVIGGSRLADGRAG